MRDNTTKMRVIVKATCMPYANAVAVTLTCVVFSTGKHLMLIRRYQSNCVTCGDPDSSFLFVFVVSLELVTQRVCESESSAVAAAAVALLLLSSLLASSLDVGQLDDMQA